MLCIIDTIHLPSAQNTKEHHNYQTESKQSRVVEPENNKRHTFRHSTKSKYTPQEQTAQMKYQTAKTENNTTTTTAHRPRFRFRSGFAS